MAQSSRPCDGCGAPVPRTKPTGPIPPYCSDDCKPRCSVADCDNPRLSRGWCTFHYTRWKLTGDVSTPLERRKNAGECGVVGCRHPMRKRGWCASHYAQAQRSGTEPRPFGYKWADRELLCRVCASPVPDGGGRRFLCSGACEYLYRNKVPSHLPCVGCGVKIDLTKRGKGGQRVKATVKLCRRCRQDKRKHGMSVEQLAARDGTACGICREPVDMTIRRRDPDGLMCASVDHVVPRARGGTNDPENLQLAHLLCNHRKSDRLDSAA